MWKERGKSERWEAVALELPRAFLHCVRCFHICPRSVKEPIRCQNQGPPKHKSICKCKLSRHLAEEFNYGLLHSGKRLRNPPSPPLWSHALTARVGSLLHIHKPSISVKSFTLLKSSDYMSRSWNLQSINDLMSQYELWPNVTFVSHQSSIIPAHMHVKCITFNSYTTSRGYWRGESVH